MNIIKHKHSCLRGIAFAVFLSSFIINAQEAKAYRWLDAKKMNVYGRLVDKEREDFNRLPASMETEVREPVWRLSQHAAGLYLKFETDAQQILVNYKVKGAKSMNHMPATGVSGVDLYAVDDGKFKWVRGHYNFQDTISFTYSDLDKTRKQREFCLYLPLYTKIEWLKIGVPHANTIKELRETRREKNPVVVYGTSIAQGACASRPGMAWTSIVSRKLNKTVVNLGFSGNGLLEKPLLEYMRNFDASVFVLDCMPNFTKDDLGPVQAEERLVEAVGILRQKHSKTPILFVEHGGYSDGDIQYNRKRMFTRLNVAVKKAYQRLKEEGDQNLYLLTKEDIGLGIDSFVDGTHPNDYGMIQYAEAYNYILSEIIKN